MSVRFRLREVLDAAGMSQTDAAARANVSFATVNRMCTNATKQVSLETIERLCNALGVEPGELFARDRIGRRRSGNDR
jgi:DNA-binding Xre family transcriptional regulator